MLVSKARPQPADRGTSRHLEYVPATDSIEWSFRNVESADCRVTLTSSTDSHPAVGRIFAGGHAEDIPPGYLGYLWGLRRQIDWGKYSAAAYLIGSIGYSVGSNAAWYGES